MIIYRPHGGGGGLMSSMERAKEFNTLDEMKKYIVNEEGWYGLFTVDDIVLGEISREDDRIGWKDCRYVCTKRCGDEDYIKEYKIAQCIGYCATDYKRD